MFPDHKRCKIMVARQVGGSQNKADEIEQEEKDSEIAEC